MGWKVKDFRSYGGVKDIEMVEFCGVDLMGVKREVAIGVPWKQDLLLSKKDGFGSEEVKVVAMAAIEVSDMVLGNDDVVR
nr:hypothetical protein CFP56_43020 [Quercus suber]